MPVSRLRILIRTLHPQLFAMAYSWHEDTGEVAVWRAPHAMVLSEQYQESPFAAIINGEGGVRRRLDGPEPKLDYPVLVDLRAEGATDYVAMPMRFSNGQINIVSMSSRAPGGFTVGDLGRLYEILPLLSRLLEVQALKMTASTLLGTYLGKNTGRRVLDGLVKRGDGETLHALIWFSDLRNSTPMSETLSSDAYLATLNEFFDCMVGSIVENGGEVLKFIGDAVLAIFPIADRGQRETRSRRPGPGRGQERAPTHPGAQSAARRSETSRHRVRRRSSPRRRDLRQCRLHGSSRLHRHRSPCQRDRPHPGPVQGS